jgi:hypothetical protein
MNKRLLGAMTLAATLLSSPALAAKNVANTSQKGSLLIYPAIDIDPEDNSDTLIELSNDQNFPIQIECYYVNERKDRADFDFLLTGKQTASWDVLTGNGTIAAPQFPSGGLFAGNPNRGELVCFAVGFAVAHQLAFNHLTGTATVIHLDDTDALQTAQAFRYNAWAFAAEGTVAPPADYTVQGTAGQLILSGNGDGTYDACPFYNIANFMPGEGLAPGSGSTLGGVYTIDNDLSVVSCNQDLRQDFQLHLTKLQFTVWNANENSFTGAYACADSVEKLPLDPLDGSFTNITNFTFPVLRTANARFQVQGVASSQCPGSENAGLLGVLTSSIGLNGHTREDQELGSTTQGAGLQPGFVYWDPASPVLQGPMHH